MTSYTFSCTPALVNANSEGSMDTSVSGGVSYQRTAYLETDNSGDRTMHLVADGGTFNNTLQTLTSLTNSGHAFVS